MDKDNLINNVSYILITTTYVAYIKPDPREIRGSKLLTAAVGLGNMRPLRCRPTGRNNFHTKNGNNIYRRAKPMHTDYIVN